MINVEELAEDVRAGRRGPLARAITLVESTLPEHQQLAQRLLTALADAAPKEPSWRIGLSGVPGVGKSTLIEQLGFRLCEAGHRVAVLAVDPSSSVRGGSILGDKTRMARLSKHPGAYIRPSPTGGNLGGVHRKTRESIRLVEAAGYDVVLIETVGVGQSEISVSEMVDTFVVLMLAGAGDELQGIKKGILEVADIVAVNKADGENLDASRAARNSYAGALRLVRPANPSWRARVLTCSGETGEGVDRLWEVIGEHRQALRDHGELTTRRARQDQRWMWSLVEAELLSRLRSNETAMSAAAELEAEIAAGRLPPTLAAWRLLSAHDQQGANIKE